MIGGACHCPPSSSSASSLSAGRTSQRREEQGSGSPLAAGENHRTRVSRVGAQTSAFLRVPICHQSQEAARKGAGTQGCKDPCSRQPLGDEKLRFGARPSHLSLPWTLAGWLLLKMFIYGVNVTPSKIYFAAFDSKWQAWCPLSTNYFGVYLLRTGTLLHNPRAATTIRK